MPRTRWSLSLMLFAVVPLAACGSDASPGPAAVATERGGTVTLYNAQHEELMKAMTDAFTETTGIQVRMRNGSDLELANQIVQEGDASPADVFVTENSPAMTLVDGKAGFAALEPGTLEQVPSRYAASSGHWVGFAARATVFVYNSGKLDASGLPASLMDLGGPEWKGRFGYSPTGADFQAIVSAVLALKGEAETATWLEGLKRNGVVYQGNSTVMKAVNDGEIDGGVIYHYYWYQDQAESGDNSANTELHFFGNKDPGAFVSVSGAGVLASSKNQAVARQLIEFLTSADGQQVLADSTALEYPVGSDVAANGALRPLSEFDAPDVDVTTLNSEQVVTMMQDAGIL